MPTRFVITIIVFLFAGPAFAQSKLEDRLLPLIQSHDGQVAVSVRHLGNGEAYAYRDTEPMPTASLIKFPVMIEAYRQAAEGKIDLAKMVTLTKDDKVPGSGILTQHFSDGATVSVRDAIRMMIVWSDNTATNLVVDQIGLPATATTMEQMGFPNTKIHAKVFRRDTSIFPDRSKQFGLGSTTAADMVRLLEQLHQKKLVNEKASTDMLAHLLACEDREKFPRFLPAGTKIAHKTGSVDAVRTDAGIIFSPAGPIALCVLTNENKDKTWTIENAGNRLCADVAKAVYDHFNPANKPVASTEQQELKVGSQGDLVEALQRTLNLRLTPSPGIGVDGEFGAETESALIRFQKSHQLAATGTVSADTWKALGPLAMEALPVPEPETVNGKPLSKQSADSLWGVPFVTCKAWAIADGRTGQLLWGDHQDDKLDFASTTKIMTCYLVVKLAEADPRVLEEELIFSKRADETIGSTAGIRAGEKVSVGELLYGLMLPSGNDAATAFAEHFGPRFDPPEGTTGDVDGYTRFIAEMNRTAKRLGMYHTTYINPHGLSAKGHEATARDLLCLAHTVLQRPLIKQLVTTREHGCRVVGAGGYTRNVLWKNTNKLLEIEGYGGLKTGTTNAAGACLVSMGEHNCDPLLMVVLGSTSSDARYTDSRNLYRWAWQQRGHRW